MVIRLILFTLSPLPTLHTFKDQNIKEKKHIINEDEKKPNQCKYSGETYSTLRSLNQGYRNEKGKELKPGMADTMIIQLDRLMLILMMMMTTMMVLVVVMMMMLMMRMMTLACVTTLHVTLLLYDES